MGMRGPVRQSQLIAPFGPGALHTDRFGVSVICCGLDHWFDEMDEKSIREFKIEDEWRVKRELGIDHLRLPPDYRRTQAGFEVPNTGRTIPFLRFPAWHYCTICGRMEKTALSYQGTGSQKICPTCVSQRGVKNSLVQVRFVAVCENGHIMEFPWSEWAHRSHSPECGDSHLRLIEYGGGTLDSIEISCTRCGSRRRLAGITSSNLAVDGEEFSCPGQRMWVHDENGTGCGEPVRGSLRNASNIYFARVFSSIFLPRHSTESGAPDPETAEILSAMDRPAVNATLDILLEMGSDQNFIIEKLLKKHAVDFKEYSNSDIEKALALYISSTGQEQGEDKREENRSFDRKSFRFEEYGILTREWDEPDLMARKADPDCYSSKIRECFSTIVFIHKLRETRVFNGFTRLYPETDLSPRELHGQLWLSPPERERLWLPAATVHGEGIFLEFSAHRIKNWLKGRAGKAINERIERLKNNYLTATAERRGFKLNNELHPAFVMIHTFAHIFMNQLTFECGYSSASLRERLYWSSDPEKPMAGLLIYTAAGDSEGTMGGLVRMGKPELFEPALKQAVRNSQWCSADPVCMELAASGGQGPFSCNLAACHNCALVPETACEEFNRFLDRGVVTGTHENRDMGYFSMFIK